MPLTLKVKVTIVAIALIDCGETIKLTNLETLYPKLLGMLLDEQPMVVDCRQVKEIDTAAFQMLYAFAHTVQAYGEQVRWENTTSAFIQRAQLLGLAEAMSLQTNPHDVATGDA